MQYSHFWLVAWRLSFGAGRLVPDIDRKSWCRELMFLSLSLTMFVFVWDFMPFNSFCWNWKEWFGWIWKELYNVCLLIWFLAQPLLQIKFSGNSVIKGPRKAYFQFSEKKWGINGKTLWAHEYWVPKGVVLYEQVQNEMVYINIRYFEYFETLWIGDIFCPSVGKFKWSQEKLFSVLANVKLSSSALPDNNYSDHRHRRVLVCLKYQIGPRQMPSNCLSNTSPANSSWEIFQEYFENIATFILRRGMKPLHWRPSQSTFHLLNWSLERSFGGYLVQICSGWGRGRKSPGLAPPLVFQPPAPGGGGEVLLEKGGSHSPKTNGSKLTFEKS